MTSTNFQPNRTLFWGLMRAQTIVLLVTALLVLLFFGKLPGLAAACGGAISLIGYAWGGFQLWLHPANHAPKRMATAGMRAEIGKIVIMLLLLWLSLKQWPDLRGAYPAAALLVNFFLVQVVGWIWLARATGASPDERASGKHDG